MRKILVVLIVAAVLVVALSIPAMAAPEPSHQYPGSVVFWTQYLKGPVPVLVGDLGLLNQVGKDIVPLCKIVAAEDYANYGQWVASRAQLDK